MRTANDATAWTITGALGALALGVALIPLRDATSASNLAFAFIAFTIVIAEMGGRGAALVSAVVSALALDFFLTQPYLSLHMDRRDDVVALAALAICGLIAAAFGERRAEVAARAERAGDELEILDQLVSRLRAGAPFDRALDELRARFGLRAIALRDERERIVAASIEGDAPVGAAEVEIAPDSLVPADGSRVRVGVRGLRLPEGGGRLWLRAGGGVDGNVAAVDLWEKDADGYGVAEARAITIAASILGLELARRHAAAPGAR